MNWKQKIVAWIFCPIVMSGWFFSGYVAWVIVVVAGLTILSLGDHRKKKQKVTEAVPCTSNPPGQSTPKVNRKNVTPEVPAQRYQHRTEDFFVFAATERQPQEKAILEARAKDEADLERLQGKIAVLFEKAGCLRDPQAVTAGVVIDFLQYEVSPLMQKAAEIGEPAFIELRALEHIRDGLMTALVKVCSEGEN